MLKRIVFLVVFVLILSAGGVLAWVKWNAPAWQPQITRTTVQQEAIDPYSGPPPWQLTRPQETFNFPIALGEVGPIKPLFAQAVRYPFYCQTEATEGLGQPLVDNQQALGLPVYREGEGRIEGERDIIGYSQDCSHPTTVLYWYQREGSDKFYPLDIANNDIAQIEINGESLPFILRVELGTINRFIYSILSLAGEGDTPAKPNMAPWNNKLIYHFDGGVGVGSVQGKLNYQKIATRMKNLLARGYAVIASTGTQTSGHYNMALAEDTALRVKRQFTSQYGEPLFTLGVGGSGGALQQLLIDQNNPGALINGGVALYAYPDMITQTTFVFDCELLQYYFDELAQPKSRWADWSLRQAIEGMSSDGEGKNRFRKLFQVAKFFRGEWPSKPKGASTCTNGWRGLTPLVNNPHFLRNPEFFGEEVRKAVQWSYWADMRYVFGTRTEGGEGGQAYPRSPWGNAGVQYGLRALRRGQISPEEFIDLNARVGSWRPAAELKPERFWFYSNDNDPRRINVYSSHNMTHGGEAQFPAARTIGDKAAARAAYLSGNVFMGRLQMPLLELRRYREHDFDMHHFAASFAIRARIQREQGHSDNHVLWVAKKPYAPIEESIIFMETWLSNIRQGQSVVVAKPQTLKDSCFSGEGELLASGDDVWHGEWNQQPLGECFKHYPVHTTSRIEAGESWEGDRFQCEFKSLTTALSDGTYGDIDMHEFQNQLQQIFPQGVCDYSQPAFTPAG